MGCEYSRESTQISRSSGENAIFSVPSKGFEGVKFLPQLHYASSRASLRIIQSKSRPKSIHHAQTAPKTRSAKTRQACSRFTDVNSREFVRNSHEFRMNSRELIQISPLCTPSFVLTPGLPPPPPPHAPLHAPWPQATMVWGRVVFSPFLATPEPPL